MKSVLSTLMLIPLIISGALFPLKQWEIGGEFRCITNLETSLIREQHRDFDGFGGSLFLSRGFARTAAFFGGIGFQYGETSRSEIGTIQLKTGVVILKYLKPELALNLRVSGMLGVVSSTYEYTTGGSYSERQLTPGIGLDLGITYSFIELFLGGDFLLFFDHQASDHYFQLHTGLRFYFTL